MSGGKERNSEKRDGTLSILSFVCIILFGSQQLFFREVLVCFLSSKHANVV